MVESKSINKKEFNSNQSKQKILMAATKLFAAKGFSAATSKDIALLAGCSEGLIFKYFQDKKGLFNILSNNWAQECISELNNLPHTENLEDEIKTLVACFFDIYTKHKNLNKIFIGQGFMSETQDDLSVHHQEYIKHRNLIFLNRLNKYIHSGDLQKNIDIIQLTEMMQGYALVEVIFRNLPKKYHPEKINSLVKIILCGAKPTTFKKL